MDRTTSDSARLLDPLFSRLSQPLALRPASEEGWELLEPDPPPPPRRPRWSVALHAAEAA